MKLRGIERATARVAVVAFLAVGLSAGCGAAFDSEEEEAFFATGGKDDGFTPSSVGPTGRWRGQSSFVSAAPFHHVFGPAVRAAEEASREAERSVEESDIYRVERGVLYNLNPTRGLQTVSLARPDAPRLLGRAFLSGFPHEMYVSGGVAHVLLNDHFEMTRAEDAKGPAVFVVDARDPARPRARGKVALKGYITDSRKVGDVLYVVTTEWVTEGNAGKPVTRVSSIHLGSLDAPRVVASRVFEGSSNVVHATDQFLVVASGAFPETQIQVIDIRDAGGAMTLGAKTRVRGQVSNKHHLHIGAQNVLRVVTHEWQGGGTARVFTFQLSPAGRSLRALGSLELPNIGQLSATRSDGDRLYLVHAQWIDPLDVIDLSNPALPKLLSRLEFPEIASQLIIAGNRALGLANLRGALTAMLFDLTDPTRTSVLARAPIGEAGSTWSPALWDERAFAFFAEQKLLVVPFFAWAADQNQSDAQLIDVDLAAGTLRARGRVAGAGDLRRATHQNDRVLALAERSLKVANTTNRDRPNVTANLELTRNVERFLVADGFGLQYVHHTDARGQSEGELRAVLLSRPDAERADVLSAISTGLPTGDVFVDGRKVYVVAHTYDKDRGAAIELRVFDFADPFAPRELGTSLRLAQATTTAPDAVPMARLRPGPWRMQQHTAVQVRPNLLVIPTSRQEASSFHVVSLRDAARARLVRTIELRAGAELLDLQAYDDALFVTDFEVLPGAEAVEVRDASTVRPASATTDAERMMIPPFTMQRAQAKYFLTRYSFGTTGTPSAGRRINIPGRVVHLSTRDGLLFTLDQRWLTDTNEAQQHKHLISLKLELDRGRARLMDMTDVPEGVSAIKIAGGFAHYVDSGTWTGPILLREVTGTTARLAEGQATFQLHIKDVRNPRYLRTASVTSVQRDGYGTLADVRDTAAGRFAVISLGWGGIAFYEVADPSSPTFEGFLRTPGWWQPTLAVEPDLSSFYLAAGDYGVYGLYVSRD
jgi:hypothetical protein